MGILEFKNVSGGYYNNSILKDITFKVDSGDFFGLIGPNGSGKTTLLRLASRIISPSKGEINFSGLNIFKFDIKEFCRKVAFVSQNISNDFSFSVQEIVLMGRIPHQKRLQFETKKDFKIVEDALALTDTLNLKDKMIDELSAGERQRVLLARALAQEPELLFLDEPTSHLDIGHQIQILDLLKRLNKKNKLTIVMVLHDLNLASAYCNRIALIDNGKIFEEGSPQKVLTYQNIEAVYKTVVLVNENPVTKRPNVILVPGEK